MRSLTQKRTSRFMVVCKALLRFVVKQLSTIAHEYLRLLRLNFRLCMGLALSIGGLLNFSVGRHCDETSSEFFTCTNPSSFYYYSGFTIVVVVIGVWLITFWMLQRKR